MDHNHPVYTVQPNPIPMHTSVQLELLFQQSLAGIFFMMLDEPVVWNDSIDKEKVLDYVFDHHRITEVNQAMLDQYRATASQFVGSTPKQLFAHDLPSGRSVWRKFFDHGRLHIDTDEKRMDGSRMAVLGDYICLYDDQGRITGHFGVQVDITDRNEWIEKQEQHSALQQFFNISPELMFIRDDKGVVQKANQAWQTILGYDADELELIHLTDLIHPEDQEASGNIFNHSQTHNQISRMCRMRTKAGTYRSIEWFLQTVDGWLYATGRDVSEQLRNKEQLEILASRDNLTGLYNRHHFEMVITDLMEHADRYHESLACFMFDLDHFKKVNDTYGHQIGDDVLKSMAGIVEKIMRQSDLAFRFGGEEFLVLMPHTAIGGAAIAAEKLRAAIEQTVFPTVGHQTISIGVSERMRAESLRHWLRRTDDALYQAKQGGRNQVVDAASQDKTVMSSSRFDWQPEWNSGNAEIDSQHQELIRIANQLLHLYLSNARPHQMKSQLELMFQHVVVHFEAEEKLLADVGYPDMPSHARIHEKLVAKLNRLYQDYQSGDIKPSAFFSFVIDDVLMEHLAKVDKLYFDWTCSEE
ncbi:MAG: diguanylate cyclase [Clostridia bacterium]|nr:diguanylate cyclase [Clostridia bacterium]